MEYLSGLNVGLDGVVDQQENYKKSGFKLAYRNVRYQGHGGGTLGLDTRVVDLGTLDFAAIDDYDHAFYLARRPRFTRAWISQPSSKAVGYVRDGQLAGYAVLRKCRDGFKVGPLYADDAELANALFHELRARVAESESIFLDVPEINPEAVDLAQRYQMEVCFETARMYTGNTPDLPLARTFGVASFEIG